MDDQRFDAITEAIGAAPSRRAMFRALAGGALAMVGADALAEELGIEKKGGDGDKCKKDNDCGKGLYCKKIKKKRKHGKHKKKKIRYECRYRNGCGKKKDYCDSNDDCCSGLRCNKNKSKCVNK
ncbi:MAG: helix-turn-helix transcriptional regulator [Thermomicrobiales bacterium]|nr:helix-turn-helix transcriptional regulator [Thermomicrobiales bacterium]